MGTPRCSRMHPTVRPHTRLTCLRLRLGLCRVHQHPGFLVRGHTRRQHSGALSQQKRPGAGGVGTRGGGGAEGLPAGCRRASRCSSSSRACHVLVLGQAQHDGAADVVVRLETQLPHRRRLAHHKPMPHRRLLGHRHNIRWVFQHRRCRVRGHRWRWRAQPHATTHAVTFPQPPRAMTGSCGCGLPLHQRRFLERRLCCQGQGAQGAQGAQGDGRGWGCGCTWR